MKTIQISDESYDFLINMSKEIATQDNRATATPYFFQVQEDSEVAVPDGCGEEVWVMDGEVCLRTEEELKEAVFEWKGWDLGNKKHEKEYLFLTSYDVEEVLEENYRKVNVDIAHEFSNAFFTEKACRKHIESNRHNLNNPKTYLRHASRNEEMEMMFCFLKELESSNTQT